MSPELPRLLIVDDTPAHLALLAEVLGPQFRVQVAPSGQDALEAVAERLPDLILLDVAMPGMDGYEVCRRLKADPATREVPIIFLTGRDEEEDEVRGLELGAVDYITRPPSLPILLARIRTHLELKHARDLLAWSLEETRQAKEAAEQATRFKSAFLAMAGHEIRTPLGAMVGLAELLLATPLASEARTWASTLHTSGETLLALLNDLLDSAKIEAGRLELELRPCSLRQVGEEACGLLREQARQRGLDLAFEATPEVPAWVEADGLRLRQMLLNLLGNALKFTSQGTVGCRIQATPRPGGRVQVTLAVQDTGMGIPPEVQARLFQPFAQADASTSRRFGGTGLGLDITRRLTELMGGSIAVESREGEGSTFRIALDLPVLEGPITPPPPEPARTDALAWAGRWVLVADDNPASQLMTRSLLARWGVQARAAHTGLEALDLLDREAFDAVLLDARMPGLDGPETAHRIRARGFRVPLVGFSAGLSFGDAPLDATLSKPLRQGELQDLLHRLWALVPPVRGEGDATQVEAHLARLAEVLGDVAEVQALVGEVLTHSGSLLVSLETALEQGEAAAIARAAHDLKTNAGNVGALATAEAFRDLEHRAEARDPWPDLVRQSAEARRCWEDLLPLLYGAAGPQAPG